MITPEDVDKLAQLARIDVPSGEKEKLAKDLESILGYVSELKEAKTAEVDQAVDDYLPKNIWRPDENAHESLEKGDYIKVKKIL